MKKNTVKKITSSVSSTEDLPIRYDLYYSEHEAVDNLPLIIFLHGFKGFKDWGTFPGVCRHIADVGFAVIAMNFSLNGVGEDKMEFNRLDLFGRETLSQDLADINSVIKAVKTGKIAADGSRLDIEELGILGHSRGGQTAIAAAAEFDEIDAAVAWSAVADYNARWSDEMIRDWETRGVTEIKNGRTGQMMPIKKVVYDDALENADRVIALNRVKELHKPVLFIHAQDDEAVLYKNAEQLYEACPSSRKDILLIPGTGHTFGGSHPFEENELPEPLQKALGRTEKHFDDYLK